MKMFAFVPGLAALCMAATASAAYAQNAIQLFPPVDVRTSTSGTTTGNPNIFNSTILNLTCTPPITATISSSPDGTGNVLVDNFITFSSGGVSQNICSGGTSTNNQPNCFTSAYQNPAGNGSLNGTNPDTLVANGGVPPIDVSSLLSNGLTNGMVQATISMVDTGSYLAGSSLYLVTSCTSQGVTGPAKVTGNPIPMSNPSNSQLSQGFTFNPTTDQAVQFTYDLNQSKIDNTLTIVDGTVPSTGDLPIDPTTFSSTYLNGTSFATANCLLHTGELFNGSQACKLYTLTCQQGTNSAQSGSLCPTSSQRNEIFQEFFDGPSFTLQDHQGVGFLEAKDGWGGQSCVFDQSSGLANLLCPQNVLTSFSGPGSYTANGRGQNPNSTFISVAPVLEPITSFIVTGLQPGNWINTPTATVNFTVNPPSATGNNFVAAPIQTLTYGISDPSNVPPPDPPVSNDTILTNSTKCPTPGSQNPPPTEAFTPPAQTFPLSDGNHLVHYLAQDCAGTEELKFVNSGGSWSTSFYTFPINVDTVSPAVATGPTLSPAQPAGGYTVGSKVMASYSCTDDRSGIVTCGASTYSPSSMTLNTGVIMSPVDTGSPGMKSYVVMATDAAGNTSTNSVPYTVSALPPANLSILKLAAATAKSGSQLVYGITVADLGKQSASSVVISDPLPTGVSFVSASALQLVCSNGKCTNQASCSFANNTVSCSASTVTLLTPVVAAITVKVTAQSGTKITNTATVNSANPAGQGKTQSSATTTVK